MENKILKKFIKHLNNYTKIGDVYYQKGYSRQYNENDIINHFNKRINDRK